MILVTISLTGCSSDFGTASGQSSVILWLSMCAIDTSNDS